MYRRATAYPLLVVLYSTLRMGLHGSGFFPSLGCFPGTEQTDDTLLCQFSPLTLPSTLLSSCLFVPCACVLFLPRPPSPPPASSSSSPTSSPEAALSMQPCEGSEYVAVTTGCIHRSEENRCDERRSF